MYQLPKMTPGFGVQPMVISIWAPRPPVVKRTPYMPARGAEHTRGPVDDADHL